jgi:hypothetical protein
MTQDEVKALIVKRAIEAGLDPKHVLTMASIESSFDPNAGRGAANPHKGLFQFGPSEWQTWGGGKDIYDPNAQIDAFIGYHGQIKEQLTKALGREPTPQELYLGWQQGAGGASKLLTNPNASAAELVGSGAVTGNAGKLMQTASGFASQWADTYNKHLAGFGDVPSPAGVATASVEPPVINPYMPTTPVPVTVSGGLLKEEADPYAAGTKAGLGLLAQQQPKAPDFMPAPQAIRPQVKIGMPDFTQMLAQQRLMRRGF